MKEQRSQTGAQQGVLVLVKGQHHAGVNASEERQVPLKEGGECPQLTPRVSKPRGRSGWALRPIESPGEFERERGRTRML